MKNYVELSDEVRKHLGLEKNTVYNLYTLPTLKYPVKFTDIGLVHAINDGFMDYPILLELMLGFMELKKEIKLEYKKVPINDKLVDFYPLFHMNNTMKVFKKKLHKDENCAQDVVNTMQYDWAEEVLNDECFNADIIAPFVLDSVTDKDCVIECMRDLYHYVLEYIFDNHLSVDICETIVYNDCVDYINESNIVIDEYSIQSKIRNYFNWSEPYEDALEYVVSILEGGNE